MLNLVLFVSLGFALINAEDKAVERKASLIVLPPLVIGYDELYQDAMVSAENPNPQPEALRHKRTDMETDTVIERENKKYFKKVLQKAPYENPSDEFFDLTDGLVINANGGKEAIERTEAKIENKRIGVNEGKAANEANNIPVNGKKYELGRKPLVPDSNQQKRRQWRFKRNAQQFTTCPCQAG